MIKVVSVEKMRQIEAAADASGLSYDTLMQNAGAAVAHRAVEILAASSEPRVTILIGSGNNGGDGLVAGRLIAQESSAQVRFYLLKHRDEWSDSRVPCAFRCSGRHPCPRACLLDMAERSGESGTYALKHDNIRRGLRGSAAESDSESRNPEFENCGGV